MVSGTSGATVAGEVPSLNECGGANVNEPVAERTCLLTTPRKWGTIDTLNFAKDECRGFASHALEGCHRAQWLVFRRCHSSIAFWAGDSAGVGILRREGGEMLSTARRHREGGRDRRYDGDQAGWRQLA